MYGVGDFPSLSENATVSLSVIVPAYNEDVRLPQMLDEALHFLEAKTKRNLDFSYEIIVVDDGSRDGTCGVVLKYSKRYGTDKVRLLRLHRNHGKGGAVRKGCLRARGAMILMVRERRRRERRRRRRKNISYVYLFDIIFNPLL